MPISITPNLASPIPFDIYPPQPLLEDDDSSSVILILQGVEIDKLEYTAIATELTKHQFWVIVPNCFPVGRDYLCPDNSSAAKVFAALKPSSCPSLNNALDRGVILLGHSAGGMAAFGTVGANSPELSSQLMAIVTYGSNAPSNTSAIAPLPPILMLSGEKDSVVPQTLSRSAFQRIPAPAKTFIELTGLNHYSINDSPQPSGAPEEDNTADFSNQDSVRSIAFLLSCFVHSVQSQQENWLSAIDRDIVSAIGYTESTSKG
ncbi:MULTISPECIES: alpha/beta hydrolase [unclassified Microcoleus]|uniref:alpha/beta hydrolase n=1 Tax=unclassified Microcoleus TaxID=2642155 RepID=UPI0025EA9D4B|nr:MULTISPECIES: alpha/beta hydrolase [unclassified Microcoleus]